MKKSDKNLIKRATSSTGDALASNAGNFANMPDEVALGIMGLSVAWNLSKALLGNALELRRDRAMEWVEMVRDNPGVFSKDILETEEFQDGFIVALEKYLKLRSKLKRQVARRIFKSFTTSKDKENYKLEALNSALETISTDALNLLKTIEIQIIPMQEKQLKEELKKYESADRTTEQWMEILRNRHPISNFFYKWLDEKYGKDQQIMAPMKPNPKNPSISSSTQILIKDNERSGQEEIIAELANLGIIRINTYVAGGMGWSSIPSTGTAWRYTKFGKEFVNFLHKDEEINLG